MIGRTLAANRFVVERELGQGHFGFVFAARDTLRGESVALKAAPGRADKDLQREYEILLSVGHPNVVRALDFFPRTAQDPPFFTMELVEGEDFVSYIRREDEMTPPPLTARPSTPVAMGQPMREFDLEFFRQCSPAGLARLHDILPSVVAAIDAIHVASFVHGDLQPDNVLVTHDGRAVVLDFGLAAAPHDRPEVLGTAAYLAPEYGDASRVGPAVDWYALGVMLFQSLTGQLPFEGSGPDALARKQGATAPDPGELVRRIPPDLREICVGLLRMNPSTRFGAADVLRILTPR